MTSSVALVVWILVLVLTASGKGPKAFLWVLVALLSSVIIGFLVFLSSSNFYPCNPEECKPLEYGIIVLVITQVIFVVWYFVGRRKKDGT
jgi:hypothetical protein